MTHCERLLEVLSDGQPHDHLSLYRLGMIVHSRVADLRRAGHRIACWQVTEDGRRLSVYQLVGSTLDTGEATGGGSPSPVSSAAPAPSPAGGGADLQLSLVAS